jgi:quercetin dioxygenase-like cupin family protein
MAIPHTQAGELIDLSPLGKAVATTQTATLVKTPTLELIRLVLPAGKVIPEHRVAGEMTVQCLEGNVRFTGGGKTQTLTAGKMLWLAGNQPHALEGLSDASVLVTILLR